MILWLTGLPGIGKTTFLRRRLPTGVQQLEVDQLRDELSRSRPNDSVWPPTCDEQRAIYASPLRYIEYYDKLGRQLWRVHEQRFARMCAEDRWVIEVSPFLLAAFPQRGGRLFLNLTPEMHVPRLARRHALGETGARALLDFYRSSLALTNLMVERCVDLSLLERQTGFAWDSYA